jgi:hypothetical protein
MRRKWGFAVWLICLPVLVGCTPRVLVRHNPGPQDTGIRYYRPKPYLKVEPAGVRETEGRTTTVTPSDEYVSISLEYLPDFSEEYSIDVRPGLGVAEVSIALEDGWNLTAINQTLDSQTDENIEAIAELAKAATEFVPSSSAEAAPPGSSKRFVVEATNVPIGYYESVISEDGCGRKRLYGWRYVGFLPFAACPTEMCGSQHLACSAVPSDLFGLVFRNGAMVFQRLDRIDPVPTTTRVGVETGDFVTAAGTQRKLDALIKAVRRAVLENEGIQSRVEAELVDGAMTAQINLALKAPLGKRMTEEALIRDLVLHEAVAETLRRLGDPMPSFSIQQPSSDPQDAN